jgi:hypothetical protein
MERIENTPPPSETVNVPLPAEGNS